MVPHFQCKLTLLGNFLVVEHQIFKTTIFLNFSTLIRSGNFFEADLVESVRVSYWIDWMVVWLLYSLVASAFLVQLNPYTYYTSSPLLLPTHELRSTTTGLLLLLRPSSVRVLSHSSAPPLSSAVVAALLSCRKPPPVPHRPSAWWHCAHIDPPDPQRFYIDCERARNLGPTPLHSLVSENMSAPNIVSHHQGLKPLQQNNSQTPGLQGLSFSNFWMICLQCKFVTTQKLNKKQKSKKE